MLAFLVAIGAPAVWPVRTFDRLSVAEILRKRPGRLPYPRISVTWQKTVSSMQFILAALAVINLYHTIVQFTIQTVDAGARETQFCPLSYVLMRDLFTSWERLPVDYRFGFRVVHRVILHENKAG